MNEKRRKRPRIKHVTKGTPPVKDPLEYVINKSSKNVKYEEEDSTCITYNIWYDKHYIQRLQTGDEEGERLGIEKQVVLPLVKNSIKHLFVYASKLEKFKFISPGNDGRPIRVLLCQSSEINKRLNVVISIYLDDLNRYEITIVTAMCQENFKSYDGQYMLSLIDSESSELLRFVRGKYEKAATYQL